MLKFVLILLLNVACSLSTTRAQDNLYTSYTTETARARLYRNLTTNTINKNLGKSLTDTTEQNWMEAFGALELLRYRNTMVDSCIDNAFNGIQYRSLEFERAALELAFANYPGRYVTQTAALLLHTNSAKVFAMAAEYILLQKHDSTTLDVLEENMVKKFAFQPDDPVIAMLSDHINDVKFPSAPLIRHKAFNDLFDKKFLPAQIIMYSLQRKNRDYPGIVVIRNRDGKFIRDSGNTIFNVPQLARSIANVPVYLTNGNTPPGIFRMHGFDVSRSNFIGPSPNIQLSLPVESTPRQFFGDSTIADTVWNKELYSVFLPQKLKEYAPLYSAFYAGLAGRTEIIAHGTTIDPGYYKGQTYYPHTPSQGCLCTKEIWNGKRIESNQLKLVNALLKAGGAYGYCVVLELDDKQAPVVLQDILPFLLKAESGK